MTLAGSRCDPGGDAACAALYYLVDPPVGTFDTQVSLNRAVHLDAAAITLYGIDQINPVFASGTTMGSGSTTSLDLAAEPGDLDVDVLAESWTALVTPGSGQTTRWDSPHSGGWGSMRGVATTKLASGTTVSTSYTWNGIHEFASVGVVFRSAVNSTATPTMTPSASPTASPTVPALPSGAIWRKYYFAGAQRVAMRVTGDPISANNGVFYLLGDHLGSTNIIANENGIEIAEMRYKAWGELRYPASPPAITDYRYTGQREEAGIGLYYYNARWYDPVLGRFAQADTIVPGGGPMAWDRYAYVSSNPLRFVDPTGHGVDCGPGPLCIPPTPPPSPQPQPEPDPEEMSATDPQPLIDYCRMNVRPCYAGYQVLDLFLYYRDSLPAWWGSEEMTIEEFLGLMMLSELADAYSPDSRVPFLEAVQRQLWTGDDDTRANAGGPYCTASPCVNGVFNFLARYSGSVWHRLDGRSPLSPPAIDTIYAVQARALAAEFGRQALHPSSGLVWDQSRPYHWGNSSEPPGGVIFFRYFGFYIYSP